jgi:hypothetical protein
MQVLAFIIPDLEVVVKGGSEIGCRKSEIRGWGLEDGGWRLEGGSQRSDVGSQKSEVRTWRSETGRQLWEDGSWILEIVYRNRKVEDGGKKMD